MSSNGNDETSFDDVPIITYSNRLQKHMFKLTEELALRKTIINEDKRKLRLLIANLPPQAKEQEDIKAIYDYCETDKELSTLQFDKMYSVVSDWIYKNILQDAFKAKPVFKGGGRL